MESDSFIEQHQAKHIYQSTQPDFTTNTTITVKRDLQNTSNLLPIV